MATRKSSSSSSKSGGSTSRSSKSKSRSKTKSSSRRGSESTATTTTDHDEIRNWAEQRGGKPACVRGTGDSEDAGLLRIDFPGYSGAQSLQKITWDEFFEKFDDQNLALLYQQETKSGEQSNFNKLVNRDQSGGKRGGGKSHGRSAK